MYIKPNPKQNEGFSLALIYKYSSLYSQYMKYIQASKSQYVINLTTNLDVPVDYYIHTYYIERMNAYSI